MKNAINNQTGLGVASECEWGIEIGICLRTAVCVLTGRVCRTTPKECAEPCGENRREGEYTADN